MRYKNVAYGGAEMGGVPSFVANYALYNSLFPGQPLHTWLCKASTAASAGARCVGPRAEKRLNREALVDGLAALLLARQLQGCLGLDEVHPTLVAASFKVGVKPCF